MLSLIAIAFLLKRYGTQAVPLPAYTPSSSVFEPPSIFPRDGPSNRCHSRIVLDILWSCLATTLACTWVSVHPNVSFKGEGRWTLLRRRLFLMFFSILAPEFMIMWAFKQWRGAVMIREAVNEASRQAFPDARDSRQNLWTTAHGHLLQMGGLRLSTTARENFYWGGLNDLGHRTDWPHSIDAVNPLFAYISRIRKQLDDIELLGWRAKRTAKTRLLRNLITEPFYHRQQSSQGSWSSDYTQDNKDAENIWEGNLTMDSFKVLLSENLIRFPTITEDEINDRSKGEALSKGIALLQLTWFIVQITSRATHGLAITELELTTAALAGLNSVMYIFWWSKPRDVRFPVVIRTKGVEELLAKKTEDVAWSFSDHEFDIRKHLWASTTTSIKRFFDALDYFVVSFPIRFVSLVLRFVEDAKVSTRRFILFFSRVRIFLSRTRIPEAGENVPERTPSITSDPPSRLRSSFQLSVKHYTLILVHGAKSAMKFASLPLYCLLYFTDVVIFIPIAKILKTSNDASMSGGLFFDFDTKTENETFSMIFYSENAGVRPLLSTSSVAGALFGAVHCLAWHFNFPSHVEQIMWRITSLGVVGACLLSFAGALAWELPHRMEDNVHDLIYMSLHLIAHFLLPVLVSLIYPVARITLLVLAISSLRSLPPSAFDTVDWVEIVPHI